MVDKNKIIKLTNRDTGFAGYTIPDTNTHRSFSPGETKEVTFDEIEKLSWASGGREILRDYLIIQDKEAAEEILGHVEPEYFYTKKDVDTLLNKGTTDQLKDALEFGPTGVKELIKQEAVATQVDSTTKRDIIQEATNFNVSRSIDLQSGIDNNGRDEAATSHRRSAPIAASHENSDSSSVHSKYKIVQ